MVDKESLLAEIAVLEELIIRYKGVDDPETRWAVYLLDNCLIRRKGMLRDNCEQT